MEKEQLQEAGRIMAQERMGKNDGTNSRRGYISWVRPWGAAGHARVSNLRVRRH